MSQLQACYIRDNFLINLNNRRNEINTKFKQISDNLVIRQNQLHTALDGIEKKYLESRNAENELKQTEKYRHEQNKDLQGSFLPENITSPIKLIIDSLDVQIAELRQKLVTYTNIDIKLDTDSINTLIDKLGSVKLTEDNKYNPNVDYITDMCNIDPCESYNPNNISTDTFGNKKREQHYYSMSNNSCNNSPIEDEDTVPEMGQSQSSSFKQSTPLNLNKNPCESYSPLNKNINNTIVCTDALSNWKHKQGNVMSNKSPIEDVNTIPEKGIPDSQIQVNLNENVRPNDNNGNPECTVALRDKNTIHNAEADTQVRGRNRRQSILIPDTNQAAQDVRIKLGFFARFFNLPNLL